MEVRSEGPLRAGSLVFRSAGGAFTFTVVAKATFMLTPGESPFVTTGADAVAAHDLHWSDDPRQSLRCASDLVPFKRFPEVVVIGSAYTPSGRMLGSLTARIAIAEVDKAIEIHGQRYFDLDGNLSDPAAWTRMPLRWERAAGGPGTSNPAGVPTGGDAEPDQWGRIVLPNLCPPWSTVSAPHDIVPTIGLGPISADWPERRARLHRHAATWDPRAQPVIMPDDLDPLYFNSAPADQHLSCLTGDEAILLENLHPEHARLSTRLERTSPVATLALGSGGAVDIPLACDTLWIDTDRGVATLTFRGHLHLSDPAQPGTVIVGLRGASPAVAPSAVASQPAARAARARSITEDLPAPTAMDDIEVVTAIELEEDDLVEDVLVEDVESTVTVAGDASVLSALLPFGQPARARPARERPEVSFAQPGEITETGLATLPLTESSAPAAAFPFAPPASAPFAPPASVTDTAPAPLMQLAPSAPSVPFASPAPTPPPPSAPAPGPGLSLSQPATFGERLVSGTLTLGQALHARAAPGQEAPPAQAPEPFVPPPTPASEAPAPPPLLGALGVPETVELEDTAAPENQAEAPAPPAPEPPAGPPPLPLEAYPLERCAAITASIDRRPDDRAAILESSMLDEPMWGRLSEHWQAAVDKELARFKNNLLRAQDAAYVDRIEQERGAIAAHDYARLSVAAEVGTLSKVSEEMTIPEAGWPRIRRVWMVRTAKDPRLAAIVRSLMDQES
jgi:hypothetical protein